MCHGHCDGTCDVTKINGGIWIVFVGAMFTIGDVCIRIAYTHISHG